MTTKKAAFVLVDKSGCFSVKERLKVHQSIERTPKRHSLLFRQNSTGIESVNIPCRDLTGRLRVV